MNSRLGIPEIKEKKIDDYSKSQKHKERLHIKEILSFIKSTSTLLVGT